MVGILFALLRAHAGCRGGAVMAVCHIECIHLGGEYLGDALNRGGIVDHPELVAEVVLIREFVLGRALDGLFDDCVQLGIVAVGEEHRLDVGVLDAHMDHAVVLLVLAGELMLLDDAVCVVVGVGAEHEAVLGALAHGLGVNVVALRRVSAEPSTLAPELEVLHRLVVHLGGVLVGDWLEIYLGLGDVQERLLPRHLAGFQGVKNVIRGCCDLGHNILGGPEGCKRFYSYHWVINFISLRYGLIIKKTRGAQRSPDYSSAS